MDFADVADAVRRATGREPAGADARDEGAYSQAGRWVVTFADGVTAFVKAGDGAGVSTEHAVLSAVESPHVPRLLGYDAGPPPVLVTEDLSSARWGTPVTPDDAAALRDAIDAVTALPAPPGVRAVSGTDAWTGLDPASLAAAGVAPQAWLDRHLPALRAAWNDADPAGDRLVHRDVWLQNWCRTDRGVVFVDWASGAAADPREMLAMGEAAVRAAGGPPGRVLPAGHPAWAARMAARAAYAVVATTADEHPRLVETQLRELTASLRWACDELGLPYADPAWPDPGPWRP